MSKKTFSSDFDPANVEGFGLPTTEEKEWITKLRKELLFSKMTHNFTLTRDEVMELLRVYDGGRS